MCLGYLLDFFKCQIKLGQTLSACLKGKWSVKISQEHCFAVISYEFNSLKLFQYYIFI